MRNSIAREQRGLVAAGAGADFEDDVALVHRILRQQCELDLLLQAFELVAQVAAFVVGDLAHLGVGRGVVDQRLDTAAVPRRPTR